MMMKRSISQTDLKQFDGTTTCFGVSQGHYAVATGITVGTDSLGSCFALIASQGSKVFMAHVHSGAPIDKLIQVLEDEMGTLASVLVVRGKTFSRPTYYQIEALKKHFGKKLKEDSSLSGAVTCDSQGKIGKPGKIDPSNHNYRTNNTAGALMGDIPLANMSPSEKEEKSEK
jgi:hypothetical protein